MSTLIDAVKNSKGKKCVYRNGRLSLGYPGVNTHTVVEVHDDRVILASSANPRVRDVVHFDRTEIQLAEDIKVETSVESQDKSIQAAANFIKAQREDNQLYDNAQYNAGLMNVIKASLNKRCSFRNGVLAVGYSGINNFIINEILPDGVRLASLNNPQVKSDVLFGNVKVQVNKGVKFG